MNKSDKELTVDVVNTFIQSWNAKNSTVALNSDDVVNMIGAVYKTIHSLPCNEE